MEEQVQLTCEECGAEVIRSYKEPPKNAREGKQPLFHCEYCGAVNLRDGTVRGKKEYPAQKRPQEEKDGSFWKILAGVVFTVISGIVLGKVIKSRQGNVGGNQGGPAVGHKYPWEH